MELSSFIEHLGNLEMELGNLDDLIVQTGTLLDGVRIMWI